MKVLLAFFLSLAFFPTDTENIYGSYRLEGKGMLLNLSPPGNYTLFVAEQDRRSGMVTSKEVSRGAFEVQNDTLKLIENLSDDPMTLLVTAEEKLTILNVKGLSRDETFLCWSKYDENGNLQYEGSWKRGKKHGTWVYYDEEGKVEKTQLYRKGKLKGEKES